MQRSSGRLRGIKTSAISELPQASVSKRSALGVGGFYRASITTMKRGHICVELAK